MKKILASFCTVVFLTAPVVSQEIVFNQDFENATPGDISGTGAFGTATVGTSTVPGGFISSERIVGEGTETEFVVTQAYTSGTNAAFNGITIDRLDGVFVDATYNDVGTPAGNFLTANFSSPAAITGGLGAGQTTTVDFDLGGFGTSNANAFKYVHVQGLSSAGAEVFQLLWRAGSTGATRQLFARELGEDNTTFAAGAFSEVDGTAVLENVGFGVNSTGTNNFPSFNLGINVTIDDAGWNVTGEATGGTVVGAPVTGLSIDSTANDLASLVFFTSHNAEIDGQNKGFWVDNLVVATDLTVEPSGLPGDYDNDNDVDADDIDLLSAQLGNPASVNPLMNLDTDDTITLADHDLHITTLVQDANGTGALIGDLNLDGDVDVSQIMIGGGGVVNVGDASVLLANLGTESGAGYAQGDLNGDGDVDVSQIAIGPGGVVNLGDASILLANLGQTTEPLASPAASAVPEPGSLSLLAVAAIGLISRRKRS